MAVVIFVSLFKRDIRATAYGGKRLRRPSAAGRNLFLGQPVVDEVARNWPSPMTSTRSEMPSTRQFELIMMIDTTLFDEFEHQFVDLVLGTDVDTARRLVEDQHLWVGIAASSRARPLLVTAGQAL